MAVEDTTGTGIESINNRITNTNVCDNTYNLAGQRINENAKGIQMKNGRKRKNKHFDKINGKFLGSLPFFLYICHMKSDKTHKTFISN